MDRGDDDDDDGSLMTVSLSSSMVDDFLIESKTACDDDTNDTANLSSCCCCIDTTRAPHCICTEYFLAALMSVSAIVLEVSVLGNTRPSSSVLSSTPFGKRDVNHSNVSHGPN